MWAKQTHVIQRTRLSGFTIVELLIVIVVIAILAVISVVAYNGITNRARTATLTSDLTNAAKTMGADNASNGSYALSAGAVDGGKGLPASSGTTYQFRSTGTTYCITGTSGKISYMISNTSTTPTDGACPGDLIGGNIANLVTNPGLEANITGWGSTWVATPVTRVTSGGGIVTGAAAVEINPSTANASGGQYNFSNLQPNTPYTISAYITLISGDPTNLSIRIGDGAGTRSWRTIASSLVVGEPIRMSLSWTSSATPNGAASFWRNGASPGAAVIRIDNAMITTGSTLYTYADGSSPSWTWTGTANGSTSMGPPL